jgi:exopolysaccharide production protein ExoQ
VLATQATVLIALAFAICLLVTNRPRSRSGFIIGACLAGGVVTSSLLGAHGGLVRGAFYLPIILLGLSTVYMTHERVVRLVRWSTRAYVYGSLFAAVIAPSWAFHAAPGGVALPGLQERLFGVGFHPNYLGFTAVVAIIVEATAPRSRFWTWHASAALIVLMLAGSRMAWIALIAAALVWGLLSARRRSEGVAGVFAASGLVLVGIYLVIDAGTSTVANLDSRTPIWHQTISLWHQSPWFGIGPGLYSGAPGSQAGVTIAVDQAHNQVLQTLAESGIVGVVLLAVLLIALSRAALLGWHAGSAETMAVCAAFVCLMFSESPLRVTGASHGMYIDVVVFLLVLQRSLASGADRALVPRDVASYRLRTSQVGA